MIDSSLLLGPLFKGSIEDPYIGETKALHHKVSTRSTNVAILVIDHNKVILSDTNASHHLRKMFLRGHHVAKLCLLVSEALKI